MANSPDCKQYDEEILKNKSEKEITELTQCVGNPDYKDLLLNPLFLDFNWHQKPTTKWNTTYTYEDVISRSVLAESHPYPELKEDDFKNPSNRGTKAIYLKLNEGKKDYISTLLKCTKTESGLTPEEYLLEQEALIRGLKMFIQRKLKNVASALNFLKQKTPIDSEAFFQEDETKPKIYEFDLKADLSKKQEFYKTKSKGRQDAIQAFNLNISQYSNLEKRMAKILVDATSNSNVKKQLEAEFQLLKSNEPIAAGQVAFSASIVPLDVLFTKEAADIIFKIDPTVLDPSKKLKKSAEREADLSTLQVLQDQIDLLEKRYESVFNPNEKKRIGKINIGLKTINEEMKQIKQALSKDIIFMKQTASQGETILDNIASFIIGGSLSESENRERTRNMLILDLLIHFPESFSTQGLDDYVTDNKDPISKNGSLENKLFCPDYESFIEIVPVL